MSDPTLVELRVHLEQRIEYEREIVDQHFVGLESALVLQRDITEKHLALQTAEIERRLRLVDVFKIEVSNELARIASRSMTWTAAIGLGFTILSIILAVALSRGGP